MKLSNTYSMLGEVFFQETLPVPVKKPQVILWNSSLAEQLSISGELSSDPIALAHFFSGNKLLPGSEPIATAYAGHQFGSFVPQLGDGRAHLLGDVLDLNGKRWDIQLKGSGRTKFSRRGDGRCAIGPALREFIMSEAMHALGVPTTRCLAVVTTGEPVFRDSALPGAIVTRVASSHLRVGTFQFFAAQGNHQALKSLADFTIERHFPELKEAGANQYFLLLDRVIERQVRLVVEWMRIGFIHGVLNTDNTALSGETIDYGPCAMMGIYDPQTVYSSIDTFGRYAFGKQPEIIQWNMARLAECLLPLINTDQDKAIEQVGPMIAAFTDRFMQAYMDMLGKKFGLLTVKQHDQKMVVSFLDQLKKRSLDYTVTFDLLTKSLTSAAAASQLRNELGEYFDLWQKRITEQQAAAQEVEKKMRQYNPLIIPRNHHVEAVLQECTQSGQVTSAEKFLGVLSSPYAEVAQTFRYQDPPIHGDENYQTFCGT